MKLTALSDVPASKLEALSSKTYFFGHQSVGRDMLDGLRLVMESNPAVKLQIVENYDGSGVAPGAFIHANVGTNQQPETKVDHYRRALDAGLGNRVDAAFLKFCYVDLIKGDDPVALFKQYQASIEALKAKYPQTTFVHFTMPLHKTESNWKTPIKNLLGREVYGQNDNIPRNEYNQLLRDAYKGKEPVFDIAYLESIDPGTMQRTTFSIGGKRYESVAPVNTYDGGHLSESGKRWIAEQLIVFLASLE